MTRCAKWRRATALQNSGGHGQQRLWQEQNGPLAFLIHKELDTDLGRGIAPDLYYTSSDWLLTTPRHQDEVPDLDVSMLASHHGFPPKVLCRWSHTIRSSARAVRSRPGSLARAQVTLSKTPLARSLSTCCWLP